MPSRGQALYCTDCEFWIPAGGRWFVWAPGVAGRKLVDVSLMESLGVRWPQEGWSESEANFSSPTLLLNSRLGPISRQRWTDSGPHLHLTESYYRPIRMPLLSKISGAQNVTCFTVRIQCSWLLLHAKKHPLENRKCMSMRHASKRNRSFRGNGFLCIFFTGIFRNYKKKALHFFPMGSVMRWTATT